MLRLSKRLRRSLILSARGRLPAGVLSPIVKANDSIGNDPAEENKIDMDVQEHSKSDNLSRIGLRVVPPKEKSSVEKRRRDH